MTAATHSHSHSQRSNKEPKSGKKKVQDATVLNLQERLKEIAIMPIHFDKWSSLL